ncbi:saccharopine dehydrogenase family protein [Streptomyces viridiviolaceus]
MTNRIVVFGATGYAGGLAVDALLRRGIQPILAGRNTTGLAALADRLGGLPWAAADVGDPASIRALVGRGDVLVTTVGPFERFGYVAAEAAAAVGAHYVDATGEVGFVRELQRRHDKQARAMGALMLPAFGYDYVPGTLASALAVQEAGEAAVALDVGYFATGPLRRGLSQGTRATMADGLILPTTVRRDGHLTTTRTAATVRAFPVRGRRKNAFLVSGTEVLFLPRHFPHLATVEVFNGWFPALARPVQAASLLANAVAARPAGRRLVRRLAGHTAGPAGGPDERERARTLTHAVAIAKDRHGRPLAEVHVEGPSIYSLTGELMALAADFLLRHRADTSGVVGPIEAFGLEGLIDACEGIGLRRAPSQER